MNTSQMASHQYSNFFAGVTDAVENMAAKTSLRQAPPPIFIHFVELAHIVALIMTITPMNDEGHSIRERDTDRLLHGQGQTEASSSRDRSKLFPAI
jgi:hypothetical protein